MKDEFLTNEGNNNFVYRIKCAFKKCEEFYLSVSFIKKAGLDIILYDLTEALKRGAKGYLITSTYQNFTDIASLETFKKLMDEYSNFICHLEDNSFRYQNSTFRGFHSKGYLFKYHDSYELIIGSTNITNFALMRNIEWNVSLNNQSTFSSYSDCLCSFKDLFDKTSLLTSDLIDNYKKRLELAIDCWGLDANFGIVPNLMQYKALKEIERYRHLGQNRALIVSAMGTGKTYLAAFDVLNFDAKKLLYVVREGSILLAAMATFKKMFGETRSYGLFVGSDNNTTADFIFATNIKLQRHLTDFDPHQFDYIIIDEAHHAAASTYIDIMNYFKPDFYLGLTATPDRTDDDEIYSLFDNNIPYELSLGEAIKNNLIVPFHYYGIRDDFVNYSSTKDVNQIRREIAKNTNVNFIIGEIEKHKPNTKLRCLAFCCNVEHANEMSHLFCANNYPAISLSANSKIQERHKAFMRLQSEEDELSIICTVDILNEGIDIPSVNMVLFLRPTDSKIIFFQQLGRGLRKYENKEYVTVLDFIGNDYERSVQIALALSSLTNVRTMDKRYLRQLVQTNFAAISIPGVEIHIDELSRKEIIKSIEDKRFSFTKKDILKKDYINFKKYLGLNSYPKHMDYLNEEYAPNLITFMKATMNGKKNISYYNFLCKIITKDDSEVLPKFNSKEIEIIETLSKQLPLVRVDEYKIIELVLEKINNHGYLDKTIIKNKLIGYNSHVTEKSISHAIDYLVNNEKFKILDCNFNFLLDSVTTDFIEYLNDLISYGLNRYEREFGDYDGLFKLYGNYYDKGSNDGHISKILTDGYEIMKGTTIRGDVAYIFVNMRKSDKVQKEDKINYKDLFINNDTFQWESETGVTINNTKGEKLLNVTKVYLFARRCVEEDGITLPFTYFGTGKFIKYWVSDNPDNTLLFNIKLDHTLPDEYYNEFKSEALK